MNPFETEEQPSDSVSSPEPSSRPAGRRQLDDVDRTILAALRANARVPYADLARLVGLTGPSVADRVRRLEQHGVITGYHAAVAPATLGLGVTALVGIEQSDDGDQDLIGAELEQIPAIEDCWFVAGEEVFLLKVRVRDIDALEQTLGDLRRIRGVSRTQTTVVLSTRWEGRLVGMVPVVGEGG